MNSRIEYHEVDLRDVMNYYMKALATTPGYEIKEYGQEEFIDLQKGKVIFKFLLEKKEDE